jgi:hypothetical protein
MAPLQAQRAFPQGSYQASCPRELRPDTDDRPVLRDMIFLSGGSVGFAYLHWRGARQLHSMIRLLEYIALTLHLPGRPHIEFGAAF